MNLLKFAALMSAATKQDVHPAFMQVATGKKGPGATDATKNTKNSRSAGEAAEAECINEGVSFVFMLYLILLCISSISLMCTTVSLILCILL